MAKKIKNRKYTPEEVQVNDDFSFVSPADGKTYKLTFKEKLFSDKYLEFKGDGVDAVFEAGYECKNALVASAIAYENLRKPHIIAYVNSKLDEYGFNDDNVMKQHLYLLQQHGDLKTKAKAIDMFYRLKGSYAPEKKEHTIKDDSPLTDEDRELLSILNEHERNKKGNGTGEVAKTDGVCADTVDQKA